jgi:hypothetical protein
MSKGRAPRKVGWKAKVLKRFPEARVDQVYSTFFIMNGRSTVLGSGAGATQAWEDAYRTSVISRDPAL